MKQKLVIFLTFIAILTLFGCKGGSNSSNKAGILCKMYAGELAQNAQTPLSEEEDQENIQMCHLCLALECEEKCLGYQRRVNKLLSDDCKMCLGFCSYGKKQQDLPQRVMEEKRRAEAREKLKEMGFNPDNEEEFQEEMMKRLEILNLPKLDENGKPIKAVAKPADNSQPAPAFQSDSSSDAEPVQLKHPE